MLWIRVRNMCPELAARRQRECPLIAESRTGAALKGWRTGQAVSWRQDPRISRQAHPPCKSSESVWSFGLAWVSVFAMARRDLAQSTGIAAPIPTLSSPDRMSSSGPSGPVRFRLDKRAWPVLGG